MDIQFNLTSIFWFISKEKDEIMHDRVQIKRSVKY